MILMKTFFLISNVNKFLTSYTFHSFVHMDKNEKVIKICGFHHYHNLFLKNLKTKNSDMSPHLFRDMEDFHLKLFCLEFIRSSLEFCKGNVT